MSLSLKRRARTDCFIVHCSATRPSQDVGVEEIDRWHRLRGFLTIGYHFVIRRDGRVEAGRPLETVGAHARGANAASVGICLVGGVAEAKPHGASENFTPEQMAALATLLDELAERWPEAETLGHRDLPGVAKDCPSFDVCAWMRSRRAEPPACAALPSSSAGPAS